MEQYIGFITNVVDEVRPNELQPVYGISRDADLTDTGWWRPGCPAIAAWASQDRQSGLRPGAARHLWQRHFWRRCTCSSDQRLGSSAGQRGTVRATGIAWPSGDACFDQPDAGPWELQRSAAVHTFSGVMCWAACDRLADRQVPVPHRNGQPSGRRSQPKCQRSRRAWNEGRREASSPPTATRARRHRIAASAAQFLKAPIRVRRDGGSGSASTRSAATSSIDMSKRTISAGRRPPHLHQLVHRGAGGGGTGGKRAPCSGMLQRRNPLRMLSGDIAPEPASSEISRRPIRWWG